MNWREGRWGDRKNGRKDTCSYSTDIILPKPSMSFKGNSSQNLQKNTYFGKHFDFKLSKVQTKAKDQPHWPRRLIYRAADFPNPGIEPVSSEAPELAGEFFTTAP